MMNYRTVIFVFSKETEYQNHNWGLNQLQEKIKIEKMSVGLL